MTQQNLRRTNQSIQNAMLGMNRFDGTGGGSGLVLPSLGFSANAGAIYSTANASTWVDVAGSSYPLHISRPQLFEQRFAVGAKLTVAGLQGYVRVQIVGYDVTASLSFGDAQTTNGFMWYAPVGVNGKGSIAPGEYTVKLQAATDNNTFGLNILGFFLQTIPLS